MNDNILIPQTLFINIRNTIALLLVAMFSLFIVSLYRYYEQTKFIELNIANATNSLSMLRAEVEQVQLTQAEYNKFVGLINGNEDFVAKPSQKYISDKTNLSSPPANTAIGSVKSVDSFRFRASDKNITDGSYLSNLTILPVLDKYLDKYRYTEIYRDKILIVVDYSSFQTYSSKVDNNPLFFVNNKQIYTQEILEIDNKTYHILIYPAKEMQERRNIILVEHAEKQCAESINYDKSKKENVFLIQKTKVILNGIGSSMRGS
jgi:hypothetical protein